MHSNTQRHWARGLSPVEQHAREADLVAEPTARVLGGIGLAGIAVIHILDAPDAYASARYVFWLYVALVAVAVPMIGVLLHSRSPLVWAATAALAAGPLVGYLLSRSVGLPGDTEEIGNWINPLGMASLFVEAALIGLSLTRLRLLSSRRSRGRRGVSSAEWVRPSILSQGTRERVRLPWRMNRTSTTFLQRTGVLVSRPLPSRRLAILIVGVMLALLGMLAFHGSTATASGTQVLRISARAHMVLRFSTSRLHARPGRIEIIMRNPSNSGMSHGIAIRGRGVRKVGRIVRPGRSSSVTVTLHRGTFTYYCPVPGHLQAGMKGTLTVS